MPPWGRLFVPRSWSLAARYHPVSRPQFLRQASTASQILPDDIYDIVIVGGGIAGLALTTMSFDTNKALKIALLERNPLKPSTLTGPPANRCSSLTPGSVRFLEEIGAWKHINEDRIQPYYDMQVWDGISSSRIEFGSALTQEPVVTSTTEGDFIDLDAQPAIATMVENSNTLSALLTRLNDFPHLKLLENTSIEQITYGLDTEKYDLSAWPVLHLPSGPIAARLLVGADGPNSLVRKFGGIESRGWSYERMGIVATLKCEPSWITPTAWQRFLTTGPIAHLPMPDDYCSLVWSTTPTIAKWAISLPPHTFAALVNAAFRLSHIDLKYLTTLTSPEEIEKEINWRESLLKEDENIFPPRITGVEESSRAAFPLKLNHVDEYTTSRIALVGDAAHTVHPLAGQGLNLGLADVKSLSYAIQNSLSLGQDIGSVHALAKYPLERYFSNHQMLGVCDKLHKLYSVENGVAVKLRSWGLEAVNELSSLKRFIVQNASG